MALINTWQQAALLLQALGIVPADCVPRSRIAGVDAEEERDTCEEHFYSLPEIMANRLPRSVLPFDRFMPLGGHGSTSFSTPRWDSSCRLVPFVSGISWEWKGFIYLRLCNGGNRIGWAELNPCYLQFTKGPFKHACSCLRMCGSGNGHPFSSPEYSLVLEWDPPFYPSSSSSAS